jgi:hypothetical protein
MEVPLGQQSVPQFVLVSPVSQIVSPQFPQQQVEVESPVKVLQ